MRVGVVGAGIVGLATARRAQAALDAEVTVLDKEDRVAAHQTGRNSGVVHAGLYYQPGSLKAELCRRGRDLLAEHCAAHGLAYDEVGKLVIATEPSEIARLDDIEARARANGVLDLARLSAGALTGIEPHARGLAALHSPRTAIVDFAAVARSVADDIEAAGGRVRLGRAVTAIAIRGDGVDVRVGVDMLRFDRVVLCAGLQSDRVARLAGGAAAPEILPFRGEYHRLRAGRTHLVRGLIYPVPDPVAYPFLGVHFTRRVDGGVDIGPNAVLALAREGYRRRSVSPGDLLGLARSPALRALAARHWRTGAAEVAGSLSTGRFLVGARRFVPSLTPDDVERAPAGVRAQAVDPDGTLVDDFRIDAEGPVVAVRNAPSPAATSSLAIAEHIVDRYLARST